MTGLIRKGRVKLNRERNKDTDKLVLIIIVAVVVAVIDIRLVRRAIVEL